MSVRDYGLRFDSLARYAPMVVDTMGSRIRRFIGGLDPEYVEACTIVALNKDIHISRIQAVAQNFEEFRHRQTGTERAERGQQRRSRPADFQRDFHGGPRPRYSSRPPRPPPPQFQGSRSDRRGQ